MNRNGTETFVAVGEGLVEVTATKVSIVTDMAIPADRIDEAKAEEARQHAEARLREKLSDEEVASVNASLVRSVAQLQVRRPAPRSRGCRRRGHTASGFAGIRSRLPAERRAPGAGWRQEKKPEIPASVAHPAAHRQGHVLCSCTAKSFRARLREECS